MSKLRHRRGLHGFLQSFGPGALGESFLGTVVEMVVKSPQFLARQKKRGEFWALKVGRSVRLFFFIHLFGDRTL